MKEINQGIVVLILLLIFCSGYLGGTNSVNAWPVDNGVAICTSSGDQDLPKLVSDGQGGAIITWYDYRNESSTTDIYAQAIDSTGNIKWTLDGVAISRASNEQINPQLVSDGQGGAIITWEDYRIGSSPFIFTQAISSTGTVKWTNNGVFVCGASGSQLAPQLITDGQGGAIITWTDGRRSFKNYDIYAQAIDSSGTRKWPILGVAICTCYGIEQDPKLVSDGQGGAIITWCDERNWNWDIFAQAVDSTGTVKWTTNGVVISTDLYDQVYPQIVSDGQEGAIISWYDDRNVFYSNNYAQAIDSTGIVKWTANGVAICTVNFEQSSPQLISDGQGGAIVIWWDHRNSSYDIYTQAIDSTGIVKWNLDGVAISTASGMQYYPQIVSDGQGGAIITWWDSRNGNYDIYVQSIHDDGGLPVELSRFYIEP